MLIQFVDSTTTTIGEAANTSESKALKQFYQNIQILIMICLSSFSNKFFPLNTTQDISYFLNALHAITSQYTKHHLLAS